MSTSVRQLSSATEQAASAGDLIRRDYTLLSTARAVRAAPAIADRAASVIGIPAGRVEEMSLVRTQR
jgi:hypothetical protein